MNQPEPVVPLQPRIAGDPQQRDAHVERNPPRRLFERAFPVRKMAGVFPEKMADERLGRVFTAGRQQEGVEQFPRDPPGVEDAVGAAEPFEVEGDDRHAVAEEEIVRRGVAVGEHLAVFPHLRLFAPAVAQPIKFIRAAVVDLVQGPEPFDQRIHVGACAVEIDPPLRHRGVVVEPGEEPGQRGELGVDELVVAVPDCAVEEGAHEFAAAEFDHQQPVEILVATERAGDIMRPAAVKPVVVHHGEVVVLALQPPRRHGGVGFAVRQKELADHRLTALLLLIEIDVVRAVQAGNAVSRTVEEAAELRLDFILQILIKRIIRGQVPQIMFLHTVSPDAEFRTRSHNCLVL